MDILKRRYKNVKWEFKIYSQAEADDLGIMYVPWRKVKKGDWALTDDGYVGECLEIQGPYTNHSGTRRYFVFSFGRAWEQKEGELNYLTRKDGGNYYSTSGKHWIHSESKRQRCKLFVDAYTAMFMTGKIDWERLGRLYRQDQKNPAKAAKFIFRQEVIRKMIEEELQRLFSDKGITEGSVIDNYKSIYEKAEAKEKPDLRVMKAVNDEFRDLLDMNPKPVPKTFYPIDESDADFDEMEAIAEKAQLEAGQKKLEEAKSGTN